MNKKTKKGGTSFLENIGFKNINKKGIYIADDVDYNIRQGKKDDLIKKYEDNLNEAREKVKYEKEAKERKDIDERIQNEKDRLTIEERKLRTNKRQYFFTFLFKIVGNSISHFFKYGFKFIYFLEKLFTKLWKIICDICSGLGKSFNIGQGVIIKTIILILIIIAIFFSVNAFIHKKGSGNTPTDNINNLVSTDKNYSSFLINTNTPTLFGKMSNSFYNAIPDDYKIQFNFFKNKFNSIIGNDIYELVGTPREELKHGNNDGIYHIKKNDDDKNTYTSLKPKEIEIPISSISTLTNTDYNNLSDKLKEIYSIDNPIIIPIKNENDIWIYDIDNIKFKGNNDTIKKYFNDKYISFLEKTDNINEFKIKKIKSNIYNNDDKSISSIMNKIFSYKDGKYIYPK
jgi:hypothetical protein